MENVLRTQEHQLSRRPTVSLSINLPPIMVQHLWRPVHPDNDVTKVAVCVRTKDSGRFLPEWIAYHYALGVNEISVYDDDSIDDTKQV